MDEIKNYMPLLIRQALVIGASALLAHGWLTPEQSAVIGSNIDKIAGAVLLLGTLAYQIYAKPSKKALEVAKAIDLQIPPEQAIRIETPDGQPDIVVAASSGKGR